MNIKDLLKINENRIIIFDHKTSVHKLKEIAGSLNDKKSITILRQFLKKNKYTLMSKEKYIQGKKHLFYQVVPLQAPVKTPTKKDTSVTITFD